MNTKRLTGIEYLYILRQEGQLTSQQYHSLKGMLRHRPRNIKVALEVANFIYNHSTSQYKRRASVNEDFRGEVNSVMFYDVKHGYVYLYKARDTDANKFYEEINNSRIDAMVGAQKIYKFAQRNKTIVEAFDTKDYKRAAWVIYDIQSETSSRYIPLEAIDAWTKEIEEGDCNKYYGAAKYNAEKYMELFKLCEQRVNYYYDIQQHMRKLAEDFQWHYVEEKLAKIEDLDEQINTASKTIREDSQIVQAMWKA